MYIYYKYLLLFNCCININISLEIHGLLNFSRKRVLILSARARCEMTLNPVIPRESPKETNGDK